MDHQPAAVERGERGHRPPGEAEVRLVAVLDHRLAAARRDLEQRAAVLERGGGPDRVVEGRQRVERLHLRPRERSLQHGEVEAVLAHRDRRGAQPEPRRRREHVLVGGLLGGDHVAGRREEAQRERDALARAVTQDDAVGVDLDAGLAQVHPPSSRACAGAPACRRTGRAARRRRSARGSARGGRRRPDTARDRGPASASARLRRRCRSAGASARARAASPRSARAPAGSRAARRRSPCRSRARRCRARRSIRPRRRSRELLVGERHGVAVHAAGSSARSRIAGRRAPAASRSASISRRICSAICR